jgi:Ca2+-binding EF-hand superfamily protein
MDVSSIGLEALLGRYGANASRPAGDLDAATERLIKDKDQDGNGTLSAVEISISEEGFKRADADANGELDAGELKNAVDTISAELKPQGLGGPPRHEDGDEDDEDENTETSSLIAALFQQADANGDGVLSLEELEAAASKITEELTKQEPKRPPSVDERTDRLIQDRDQDGDSALSAEELPISSETFDVADTNKDGVLSFDELVAAGEIIAEELRPEGGPPRLSFESLFRSQPDDGTETTLDQIA